MLRLEAYVPHESRDAVVTALHDFAGVADVNCSAGASPDGQWDVVTAVIAREAGNDVLDLLKSLRVEELGSIYIAPVELVLSDRADQVVEAAPGAPADAVIWDSFAAKAHDDSALTWTYFAFMTVAMILAAIGVVTDSAVTVVGAMIVGVEFGPLTAVALGLSARHWGLARRGSVALLLGFVIPMIITALLTQVAVWTGLVPADQLSEAHPLTEFIYEPGAFSLIVAILAGIVGVIALTSAKPTALVGVFVSVTTVPAAGYVAVAATLGEWHNAWGSALQLIINLVGIVLAGVAVILTRRAFSRRDRRAIDAVTESSIA